MAPPPPHWGPPGGFGSGFGVGGGPGGFGGPRPPPPWHGSAGFPPPPPGSSDHGGGGGVDHAGGSGNGHASGGGIGHAGGGAGHPWLVERALVVPEVAVLRLVEVTLVMLGLGRWDAKAVAALVVHLVLQRVPGLASNFHGVPLPWDW